MLYKYCRDLNSNVDINMSFNEIKEMEALNESLGIPHSKTKYLFDEFVIWNDRMEEFKKTPDYTNNPEYRSLLKAGFKMMRASLRSANK